MKQRLALFLAAAVLLSASCGKINPTPSPEGNVYERVFIIMGLGFNSLSEDIEFNIDEAVGTDSQSSIPMSGSGKALVIFEHLLSDYGGYFTSTPPQIVSIYRDFLGRTIRDTLFTLNTGKKMTDAEVMREGLEYIAEKFPSEHYGMVLSSHGSGWLPDGYYRSGKMSSDGSGVQTFSFGEEVVYSSGKKSYYEMDITDLRDAIPMHLDYMIFDSCLMGGIEVAYEFKDKTYSIGFSVAEVLSSGFEYKKMVSRLLGEGEPNPEAVCHDYYEKYEDSSATVTFLYTSGLEDIANVCKTLFSKYRSEMQNIRSYNVQPYFRLSSKHFFYDLLDILDNSGISQEDRTALTKALDGCISYKAATDYFLSLKIERFCGFSMYLPAAGNAELNNFYKSYSWNKATGLVE